MKIPFSILSCVLTVSLFGLGGYPNDARGAEDKSSKAATSTNSAPAEVVIPRSVFAVKNGSDKNPFFPNSPLQPAPIITSTNYVAPVIDTSSFRLNGLTFSSYQPLAIINNYTFAQGESGEIIPIGSAAKVKITVVRIKEKSVIIMVSGNPNPMELFYSGDAPVKNVSFSDKPAPQ